MRFFVFGNAIEEPAILDDGPLHPTNPSLRPRPNHSNEWYTRAAMPYRNHLTRQQERIVGAFQRRASSGSPPPTYRELCREFGWSSTGTARDHIRALVQKGVLYAASRRSRGAHLAQPPVQGRLLPLVGRIVAGQPVMSDEHVEREIFVPEEFAPRGKAFVLRVSGDSMEGVGILDRDFVVVRQTKSASSRSVVAVTIDGESTLKLLIERSRKWLLVAANPRYTPIEIQSPAIIHGVVTAVMRRMENGIPQTAWWTRPADRAGR